jgi:hopanoid biosynthesis associated RND transporter like protein HpnN
LKAKPSFFVQSSCGLVQSEASWIVLHSLIVRAVDRCTQYAWTIVVLALILSALSAVYVARHFAINTNITDLISADLPWRQRELAYNRHFPQSIQSILAVIHGPTPELTAAAADAMVGRLSKQSEFHSVQAPASGPFFRQNGLLFLPTEQLKQRMGELTSAAPFIRVLAADPSLRGLVQLLSMALRGIEAERYSLDDLARPLNLSADTLEQALAGRPAYFSWKVLLNGEGATPQDLRQFINIWAKLDYSALQPGERATQAVRQAAQQVSLNDSYHATMRLTGTVPIADQEFATLQEGAAINGIITGLIVIAIMWLALRSPRLVLAVVVTLASGLLVTAALGLLMVGQLNPISVAFAVLFVGLGADFAIQFSVRYRAERHRCERLHTALVNAARSVGIPLTLAAGAAAAGFLSFMPTSYRGIAELGLIAGVGMGVAYVASLTLLPALIQLMGAPQEPARLGFAAMAPVDRFLQRHRTIVVAGTIIVSVAGLPLLLNLQFDFNPLHLRNPNEEAIATYRELSKDPQLGVNNAEVLAPSLAQAKDVAAKLAKLPEVAQVRSIESFIPQNQDEKLSIIANAAKTLEPVLNATPQPAPNDQERIAALRKGHDELMRISANVSGMGADAAKRLAQDMEALAQADASVRDAVETAMIRPLKWDLDELRGALHPQRVSLQTLPAELKQDWITNDGRTRVEVLPKGDPNDNTTLRNFAQAVLKAAPNATGQGITTFNWSSAIISAFVQAGAWALCSIAVLLWIVLRRVWDVVLTLAPLLVAAAVTLEICVLIDFPLNYANIIALPVLLGVGVAFKIYYVLAWRRGQTNFLQSTLTRAVFFSALMTATAFGSIWFSSHPGTSSMGQLLALSLACTLASAALFQPALMGQPRKVDTET